MTPPPLTIHAKNGTYFTQRGHFVHEPHARSVVVDATDLLLLPGLINTHDHLELNHYPRTRYRPQYGNAHQWGEDVNQRLQDEPFRSLRQASLADQCAVGVVKNVLSGVTTVVQHGPLHPPLRTRRTPIRVFRRYGWAHSLHFDTHAHVVKSYRQTRDGRPWFIHAAEGTDITAQQELDTLLQLGCVGERTVLVHAVGVTARQWDVAAPVIRGVVWCPTTNAYLLGQTLQRHTIDRLTASQQLTLGSDSRLTATGNLIDELHEAANTLSRPPENLLQLVTTNPAAVLRQPKLGHTHPGGLADFVLATQLTSRSDIALVVFGGQPQIGSTRFVDVFAKDARRATLDGEVRYLAPMFARYVLACHLPQQGLTVDSPR